MNCIRCGVELESSLQIPLCKDCENVGGDTVKSSDPSEILELHINSQKQHGNLPQDFSLSDVARDVAKSMIIELLKRGQPNEIVSIAVVGFCYGYLCHQKEHEA